MYACKSLQLPLFYGAAGHRWDSQFLFELTFFLATPSCSSIWFCKCFSRFDSISSVPRSPNIAFFVVSLVALALPPNRLPHPQPLFAILVASWCATDSFVRVVVSPTAWVRGLEDEARGFQPLVSDATMFRKAGTQSRAPRLGLLFAGDFPLVSVDYSLGIREAQEFCECEYRLPGDYEVRSGRLKMTLKAVPRLAPGSSAAA